MRRRLLFAAALVLCAALLDSPVPKAPPLMPPPPDVPPAASCADAVGNVTALTYNAGLGPGMVSLSSPRAPHVAVNVAAADADVVCLQEVWLEKDEREIIDALGLPPHHVLTRDTTGMRENPDDRCPDGGLSDLVACAERACASTPVEEQTLCALRNCETDLLPIYLTDRPCLDCLASGVGMPVREIARRCESGSMSHVYGGRNGVILASRWPLRDVESIVLPASAANRVVLFARVDVPDSGPIEVACTHLSSSQRIDPDQPGLETWDEEKAEQLRLASERLAARAADGSPQLFLGDMNFGPAVGSDIRDVSQEVWNDAVRYGFVSVGVVAAQPQCTVCPGNTLRGNYPGHLIDHALVRNAAAGPRLTATCAERTFVEPREIAGHDGTPVTTNLSDHYGVLFRFVRH